MHKLVINKLGPIEMCEIKCSQFMTFTGFQASGKSTIAKAIFYFRTIKDDIYLISQERALKAYGLNNENLEGSLKKDLIDKLREKFLRVFGTSWAMENDMSIEYYYTKECFIKVHLKDDVKYGTPNYIWITLSPALESFLYKKENVLIANALGIPEKQQQSFKFQISEFFDDIYDVVYIPTGRSMLTLLSQQLSYIYTTMKDSQKRTLDYCTQDYIERILTLKSEFSDGLEGVKVYQGIKNGVPKETLDLALELIQKILRGSYRFNDGEERIVLDNKRYVKINFASSGQQESVWLMNLLFYYLAQNENVMFIIEEPESNLFPESQKYITELISLVCNRNHSVVLTTHSPYVLGTLNNLLYAAQIPNQVRVSVKKIIPDELWIKYENFNAWFVKNGIIENCMDNEVDLIQNERIDEISKVINNEFDMIFDLVIND